MLSLENPFARPLYIMAKPAGAACNLACKYCYYLEKKNLYDDPRHHQMSDAVLERYIKLYIEAQTTQGVQFTWHGGETMLRPISFYQRAMELQRKYANGHVIENCIQTNGTLLNDEWCRFLRDNHWLVGLSIDGPEEFHNEYRVTPQGKPTFRNVMKAVHLLNRYNVDWNAMAVVNSFNADYPEDFYNFFKDIDCRYIQFTPIVERLLTHNDGRHLASPDEATTQLADFSVTPKQWGDFLCTIFDMWVRQDVGRYYIQLFDATLANWVGQEPGVCTMAKTCGHAGIVEYNGDVYSCDHFVFPEHKLGNIANSTFIELMYGEQQQRFSERKTRLSQKCRQCEYLFACNGECPKNRFATAADGDSNLNYLCRGYYQFFSHVAPYMDYMKRELAANRPPANIMQAIKSGLL